MNTLTKQTVCIANEEAKKQGYNVPEGFIGKYGYFFTPEQLNEYTQNVIKQTLETAAEKAKLVDVEIPYTGVRAGGSYFVKDIDKQSITNTFEKTFNKWKV